MFHRGFLLLCSFRCRNRFSNRSSWHRHIVPEFFFYLLDLVFHLPYPVKSFITSKDDRNDERKYAYQDKNFHMNKA